MIININLTCFNIVYRSSVVPPPHDPYTPLKQAKIPDDANGAFGQPTGQIPVNPDVEGSMMTAIEKT